jgi:uncharacterized phage protein gp47/JayE
MAISIPTYDAVVSAALAYYRNRFPGRDLSDTSFLGKKARAEAMIVFQHLQAELSADNDAVPTQKTSDAAMDNWAVAVGVPGPTLGAYGRKSSTAATGLKGNVTGTNATVYPDGSLLTASDGTTVFRLNNGGSSLTIPGSAPGTGSITGTFDAITTGTVGNLAAGAVLTWSSPPSGSDATVTLTAGPSSPGVDVETTQQLLVRTQNKMQQPPKGGISADFKTWAESISGVQTAYPYPLRGGLGTVHVLITGAGSGKTRDPGATVKTNVDNYVNGTSTTGGQRTVTSQGYTTLRPFFVATGLVIRCRMVPSSSRYSFDWIDTGGPYTVLAYSAGPPATITLSTALPSSLTAAVDAALKPRLQILNTNTSASGWVATPYQIGVTAYNSGTHVLTLDTLPSNWVAPNNGDTIYAGGPMVATIANNALAYIDALGPSRAGGYADTILPWEDTASIARLTQIALDALDSGGVRMAKNIISGGVTVAYNGGAAAATDVQASDSTVNGPELLYARNIAVTQ